MTPDTITRHRGAFRVTVPADRAEELIDALGAAGHEVRPTGERVTTDLGLDAEVELQVTLKD